MPLWKVQVSGLLQFKIKGGKGRVRGFTRKAGGDFVNVIGVDYSGLELLPFQDRIRGEQIVSFRETEAFIITPESGMQASVSFSTHVMECSVAISILDTLVLIRKESDADKSHERAPITGHISVRPIVENVKEETDFERFDAVFIKGNVFPCEDA